MKQKIKQIKENIQISFENEKTIYDNLSLLFNLELIKKNKKTITKKLNDNKNRKEKKFNQSYSSKTDSEKLYLKKSLDKFTILQLKEMQKNCKINRNYANKSIMIDDLILKIPPEELKSQIEIINKKSYERKIELETAKKREKRLKKLKRKEILKNDEVFKKRIEKRMEKEKNERKENEKQKKKAEIKEKIKNSKKYRKN